MNNGHSQIRLPAEQYTIDDYWLAIYRHRWMILLVTMASGVFAWWLSGKIAPRYEAVAAFYVPGDVMRGPSTVGAGGVGGDEARVRLPGGFLGEGKAYAALLEGGDARRQIASEFPGKTANLLSRDVDLVVSRQGIISVFVRDTDRELASQIANRYVSYFNEFHGRIVRESLERSRQEMQRERELVDQRKQDLERQLQEFDQSHRIASLQDEIKELEAKRTRQEDRLKAAEADLVAAQQRVNVLDQQLAAEDDAYEAGTVVLDTPLIADLRHTMLLAEIDLAQSEVELQPQHPEVLALRARVEKARLALEEEISRIVSGTSKLKDSRHSKLRDDLTAAHVELAVAEARVQSAQATDDSVRARAEQIPAILRERNHLEELIERDKTRLATLDQSEDQVQLQMMRQRDAIVVTQQATPPSPTDPVYPIPALNAGIATFAGLVVGVLYALLLSHIEQAVRRRKLRRLAASAWLEELMPSSTLDGGLGKSNGRRNGNGNGNGRRVVRREVVEAPAPPSHRDQQGPQSFTGDKP